MAFEKLTYTKTWKSAEDFPTYEPNEQQVREDLQLLHDEVKQALNALVEALNDPSAASQLPFVPPAGLTATSVQAAIEQVYEAAQKAAAGQIINGSIGAEKLTQELLERVFGGRVWVSMDLPTEAQTPENGFPVGQLWLRPGIELPNLALEDWEVTRGDAKKAAEGWELTAQADGSLLVTQRIYNAGQPGEAVRVCLQLEDPTGVEVFLNGMGYDADEWYYETEAGPGGTVEISLSAQEGSLAAYDTVWVRRLQVINTDGVQNAMPGCRPTTDWESLLQTCGTTVPMAMFVHTRPGVWEQLLCAVTPVERGGTGHACVEENALLLGNGKKSLQLLPAMDGVLACKNGKPQWMSEGEVAQKGGYLRAASGSYQGTGGRSRTVELPVTPLMLQLQEEGTGANTMLQGTLWRKFCTPNSPDPSHGAYYATAELRQNRLVFGHDAPAQWTSSQALCMNEPGKTYTWLALY